MPRVFVVNQSGHDFNPAKKFGELTFLSRGQINRYSVNEMYRRFSPILDRSEPGDYILCTALTQMNMVATAIFARKHGRVNLLIHKGQGYVARTLDLDALITS